MSGHRKRESRRGCLLRGMAPILIYRKDKESET